MESITDTILAKLSSAPVVEKLSETAHRINEGVENFVDPRQPYNDAGFGWMSRRMGYFSQRDDRAEGRYMPVYDNELDLRAIRYAAWLMDEEVPVAKAMKARLQDYTIATGFDWTVSHPSKRVAAICRSIVQRFLDASDWSNVERESFGREIVDGEFMAELCHSEGDIRFEIVEGDWLTEPLNTGELERHYGYDFPTCWTFGVLTEQNKSKPIAYHIARNESGTDWDVIEAERFIHWKRNVGQRPKRGFSDHYTTHKWMRYAEKVLSNTAQGTAIQAAIAYIVEHSSGTTQTQAAELASARSNIVAQPSSIGPSGSQTNRRRIEPGQVIDIKHGSKYHSSLLGSNASNIYIEVMEALFRLSGTVYAFPEHMLTGFAGNNNMASSIEAKSPFVQGRFADQRNRAEKMRAMLLKVIKYGLRLMPRLGINFDEIKRELEITISHPEIVSKDPEAITESIVLQLENRLISRRQAIQKLGGDYEDTEAELKLEEEREALQADLRAAAGLPDPNAPPVPAPVDPDTGEPITAPNAQNQPGQPQAPMGSQGVKRSFEAVCEILHGFNRKELSYVQVRESLTTIGVQESIIDQLIGPADKPLTEAVFDETKVKRDSGKFATKPGQGAQPGSKGTKSPSDNVVNRYSTKMLEKPTIDLNSRPQVKNEDGSISTVRSITVGFDEGEYVLPTVIGDRVVSDDTAVEHFKKSGEHLGLFGSSKDAQEYAEQLHLAQEKQYAKQGDKHDLNPRPSAKPNQVKPPEQQSGTALPSSAGQGAQRRVKPDILSKAAADHRSAIKLLKRVPPGQRRAIMQQLLDAGLPYEELQKAVSQLTESITDGKWGDALEALLEFDPTKHPRSKNGKFASKGGRSEKTPTKKKPGAAKSDSKPASAGGGIVSRSGKPITNDHIATIIDGEPEDLRKALRDVAPEHLPAFRKALAASAGAGLDDYDWQRLLLSSGLTLNGSIIGQTPVKKPTTKKPLEGKTKSDVEQTAKQWSSKVVQAEAKTINMTPEVAEKYHALAGKKIDPATLVGMPKGSEIDVHALPGGGVNIQGFHNDIRVSRVLQRDAKGKLMMFNAEIESAEGTSGLGRTTLKNQIAAARAIGVQYITARATGPSDDESERSNGYYTWPRYGYSAPVSSLRPATQKKIKAKYPQAKDILDVMATPAGRDWWRDNGEGMNMVFDLNPKSRSMQTFTAYLIAKGEA